MKAYPYVISIAGFDDTAGAGVLSDIKVFENNKVYGMGVITANTLQVDDKFLSPNWISIDIIIKHIKLIIEKYPVRYAKIGLVESIETLYEIIELLLSKKIKIVWDPILSTSSGWDCYMNLDKVFQILKKVEYITPNWNEVKKIAEKEDAIEAARQLAHYCHVYLKGGHNDRDKGRDFLFYKGKEYNFRPKSIDIVEKHGSGCVFSSSLTCNLANKYSVIKACLRAKSYTYKFLTSTNTSLGRHRR